MTIINPKPIIDREIQKTRRAVNTPSELFGIEPAIGETVFVRNRNVEYKLIRKQRGKYLDIQSPTGSDNSPNWVNITHTNLGMSTLPVSTTIEAWCRLSAITSSTVAPYDFRFGASYRAGFMMSSALIRFRPNWIAVGGTITNVADNGSGLFRITTTSAHGRNTGETVYINNIASVSSINNKYWTVTVINSTTLDLQDSGYVPGWTSGGNINQHIKFSIYDEDNIIQDSEDLDLDTWYRIVMEVQNTSIDLTGGNGLLIGPYYRNARIRHRSFKIYTPTTTVEWDFETGSLASTTTPTRTLVANPSAEAGTVQFIDDELLGNDRDYIEQVSPYRLYQIAPKDGFVTPENFGAIKQFNNGDISDEVDATAIVQACMDSDYNVLGDGHYCIKGTVNVYKPKLIRLLGSSDGTQLKGKDESLGCFYSGKTPNTMFRFFSGGIIFEGGMVDVRNAVYDTAGANLAPDYKPPAVFEYCYWKNLIQNGRIETTCIGDEKHTRVYNGGHSVIRYDAVTDHNPPIQQFPNGFGEMHYIDYKIEARFMHGIADGRLGEPYQDYTNVIGHSSIGGFKTTTATLDSGKYIISSPSDYAVAANAFKIMTLKWGTHSRFTIRVTNSGGNWIDRINDAIVNAGYSVDVAGSAVDTYPPAFKAEARVGGGTAQSFTIRSNMSTFQLTCVRPNLATVFDYQLRDIGCKFTAHLDNGDNATIKAFCQTALVLANRPSSVDGYVPTEWNTPKVTITGDGCRYDLQNIDLGKGNQTSSDYKANIIPFIVAGKDNQPINLSMAAHENSTYPGQFDSVPQNIQGIIRNHRHFSHTRYVAAGTGRDGFIGALDNVLALANKRWPAPGILVDYFINPSPPSDFDFSYVGRGTDILSSESPGAIATVSNPEKLFDIGAVRCSISYDSSFDEANDFIEISIGTVSEIDLLTGYVELGSANTPQRIQLIVQGGTDTTLKEIDLRGSSNRWLVFDGFNNGNTTRLTLRLIGVKNKNEPVVIAQFAGVSKNFKHELNPFLSNAGNVEIYGPVKFNDLEIADAGGTFRQIVPQSSATVVDYASLRAALIAANILYDP